MTARKLRQRNRDRQVRRAKRARTRHGVVCECGSVNVVIDTTRRRDCAADNGDRVYVRKQACRCVKCGRRWWRRVRVTENVLS